MSKTEIVFQTKRANTRLKPVGDACYEIAHQRHHRTLERERVLMLARLERELQEEDVAGQALRDAVADFWQAAEGGADKATMVRCAGAVCHAVRRVQTERWQRVENTYGKVSHYFDRFGQIKPHYREQLFRLQARGPRHQSRPWRTGVSLAVVMMLLLLGWWLV